VARSFSDGNILWNLWYSCTSGFVDRDILFSHKGANGPESKMTSMLTCSPVGGIGGEVCHLRLHLISFFDVSMSRLLLLVPTFWRTLRSLNYVVCVKYVFIQTVKLFWVNKKKNLTSVTRFSCFHCCACFHDDCRWSLTFFSSSAMCVQWSFCVRDRSLFDRNFLFCINRYNCRHVLHDILYRPAGKAFSTISDIL